MADNVILNTGAGGDTVAAKDVAGAKHQRVLNETLNAAGNPVDVSPTAPMPATIDSGTLLQRIELLEMVLAQMLHGAGQQPADPFGRTRVNMEVGPTAGVPVSNVSGTFLNVNLTSTAANIPALMLRDRISVT